MNYRNARPYEAEMLTQLTLASKGYWGYPEEWMTRWTEELTVRPAYIEQNMVVLAEEDAELLGYVSIIEHAPDRTVQVGEYAVSGGLFLDNLFVRPSHIRKGIGAKLAAIALDWCKERRIQALHVYSDPYAKGFYERMGAVYVGEVPTGIASRTLPFLVFRFDYQTN